MRIEELSVGDWVHHTFYEENVQIARIYGDSERVLAERGKLSISCHLNHFEPIPLTPEILADNGFVYVGGGVFSYEKVDLFYEDGKLYFAREAGYDKLLCIEHTHQLQHALRLAGIEKEIEV